MIDIARDPKTTPVIVSAVRTPIGRYLGALSALSAPELGAAAIREAVGRAGVPVEDVAELIMGNVVQGGVGQAPARQAGIKAGLPATTSALTINKVCGSGLKAVMLAAQSIRAGDSQVVIAGGQESDRKSTRLNSSHANISYAVFCLKKKTPNYRISSLH